MKTFFKNNYSKIIGVLFLLMGVFILLQNEISALAYSENEKKKIEEFYSYDRLYNDPKELSNNSFFLNVIENYDIFEDYRTDSTLNEKIVLPEDAYLSVMNIPKINLEKGIYSIDSDYSSEVISYNDFDDNHLLLEINNRYFSKLIKLELDDIIEIYYHSNKYTYKVFDKSKNILDEEDSVSIALHNKRVVINAKLESISKY